MSKNFLKKTSSGRMMASFSLLNLCLLSLTHAAAGLQSSGNYAKKLNMFSC